MEEKHSSYSKHKEYPFELCNYVMDMMGVHDRNQYMDTKVYMMEMTPCLKSFLPEYHHECLYILNLFSLHINQ